MSGAVMTGGRESQWLPEPNSTEEGIRNLPLSKSPTHGNAWKRMDIAAENTLPAED